MIRSLNDSKSKYNHLKAIDNPLIKKSIYVKRSGDVKKIKISKKIKVCKKKYKRI